MTDYFESDAFSLFAPSSPTSPPNSPRPRIFLSCEHATTALPPSYAWTNDDLSSGIIGTHWSLDIGAEKLTRDLSESLGCRGIAARFCRLFCDANRAIGEETMFRESAEEGKIVVGINAVSLEKSWGRRLSCRYLDKAEATSRTRGP